MKIKELKLIKRLTGIGMRTKKARISVKQVRRIDKILFAYPENIAMVIKCLV